MSVKQPSNAEIINQDSFEKLKAKSRHKKIFRRLFSIVFTVAICALFGFICVILFFGLKETEVIGNVKYKSDDIINACGFDDSTNLFSIDIDETAKKIKSKFSYISSVEFEKKLPSKLIIKVTEDSPSYHAEIAGDWFMMSNDLRVISRFESKPDLLSQGMDTEMIKLPEVLYAVVGEKVHFLRDATLSYMTDFLADLKENDTLDEIDCIDASDKYHINIYTSSNRYRIMLGDGSNLDSKLLLVKKVIETSFDDSFIATLNAEVDNSVVIIAQNERFSYE